MPFKEVPPLYWVWRSMRDRCHNPSFKQWRDYGGRGISICPEWDSFAQFVADMGPRPKGHTLDRRDNEKGYSPDNCKWSTRKEQQRNRRVTVRVTIDGVEYVAADLAAKYSIKTDTIIERAKAGFSFKAVTNPGHLRWNTKGTDPTCINGHAYTPQNTRILVSGMRACRTCLRENAHRRYWASK